MADSFNILLGSKIDTSRKTINQLNNQIKYLSKNLAALQLKIDTKEIQNLSNQVKKIIKSISTKPKQLTVFDEKQLQKAGVKFTKITGQMVNAMEHVRKQYSDLGQATIKGIQIDPLTKNIETFTVSVQESDSVIKNFKHSLIELQNGQKAFKIDSTTGVDKSVEVQAQRLREMHDMRSRLSNETIANAHAEAIAMNKRYDQEVAKAKQLIGTLDQTVGALRVQNETVQQARNTQLGFFKQLKAAIQSVSISLSSTTLYFQSIRFGPQLIQDISEVNSSMIELERVSDATQKELNNFRLNSPAIANSLGVFNGEVQTTASEIVRLGYSLQEAEELMKLSSASKTVGDLKNIGDSTDDLISTMEVLKAEVSDVNGIIDYLGHSDLIPDYNIGAFSGWLLGISLLIQGIAFLVRKQREAREEMDNLAETYSQFIQDNNNKISQIKELADSYTELEQKSSLTTEEQEKFYDISNQVAELAPSLVKRFDEHGNAVIELKDNYEDFIDQMKLANEIKQLEMVEKSPDYYKSLSKDINKYINDIKLLQEYDQNIISGGSIENNRGFFEHTEGLKVLRNRKQALEELANPTKAQVYQYKELEEEITRLESIQSGYGNKLRKLNLKIQESTNSFKPYISALIETDETFKDLDSSAKDLISSYANMPEFFEGKHYTDQIAKLRELAMALELPSTQKIISEINELNKNANSMSAEEYTTKLKEFIASLASIDGIDIDPDKLFQMFSVGDLGEKVPNISDIINDLITTLSDLEEIQDKVTSGYSYSYDEIEKIRQKYPKLEDAIYRTAKGWSIEESAIENLRQSQIKQSKTQIDSQLEMSRTALENSKTRISGIVKEIESIKSLADAYRLAAQLGKQMNVSEAESSIVGAVGGTNSYEEYLKIKNVDPISAITGKGLPYGVLSKDQYNTLKKQQKEVVDYGKELDAFNKLAEETQRKLDDLASGRISGGNADKQKEDKYKAPADATLKYRNAIEEANHQLSLLKSKQNLETDDLNKITLLQQQNDLLEKQQDNYHNLANVQRQERDLLAQSLAKQGFKFEGTGDNKIITNLEHVKGKSKEVEEQLKKFIDLQTKEIPSAQKNWWDLENSISSVILEMEKLQINNLFKTTNVGIEKLNKEFELLDFKLSLLDENQTIEKFELMSQKVQKAEFQVRFLADELQRLKSVGFQGSYESIEEYNNQLDDLEKKHRDAQLFLKSLNDNYKNEQKKVADEVIEAIKDGYRKEQEVAIGAKEQRIKLAEEEYKRKVQLLDDWLAHHNRVIDDMLTDMDRLNAKEDYEDKLKELTEEKINIERQLQIAVGLSDSAVDKDARIQEAQNKLVELDKEIEETMKERARTLRRDELLEIKQQNEAIVDDKKKSEDAKLNKVQQSAEEEIRLIQEKYDRLINNDMLYESIREDIMKGTYDKANLHITNILDRLNQYNAGTVHEMGKSWQELGNTINRVMNAHQSMKNINNVNQNNQSNSNGDQEIDKQIIGMYQRIYSDFVNSNPINIVEKEQQKGGYLWDLNQKAEKIRAKYGWEYENYEHLSAPKYKDGGVVDFTGIANVHGSQTNSEVIFNSSQAKKLYDYIVKLPNIAANMDISKFIPDMHFLRNITTSQQQVATAGNAVWNINMNVDKIVGNKEGGKEMFKQLLKEVRNRGGVL